MTQPNNDILIDRILEVGIGADDQSGMVWLDIEYAGGRRARLWLRNALAAGALGHALRQASNHVAIDSANEIAVVMRVPPPSHPHG